MNLSPRPEAELVEAEVEGARERDPVSPTVNSREGGAGREISQSQGSFEMTDEIEGGRGGSKGGCIRLEGSESSTLRCCK